MGLFGDMGKPEVKAELPKEEKKYKQEYRKQKKGKVALIIKDKKVIVDVGGNGEEVKYNEAEHGHLKIGDTIII